MDDRLAAFTETELVRELEARGHVVVAWNVEDVHSSIASDESLSAEEAEFAERNAPEILAAIASGLKDVVSERGNAHIDMRLEAALDEIRAAGPADVAAP